MSAIQNAAHEVESRLARLEEKPDHGPAIQTNTSQISALSTRLDELEQQQPPQSSSNDGMIDAGLGDGIQDATTAIQDRIDHMCKARPSSPTWANGGALIFPSGIFRITDTLQLPHGWGFSMIGNGNYQAHGNGVRAGGGLAVSTRFRSCGTAIMWDGPPDKPMIQFSGNGAWFHNFSLWGRKDKDSPRASVGMQTTHIGGLGTGHSAVGHMRVFGCDIAFRFGETSTEGHCADFSYQHLMFRDCGTCFRHENTYSLNHIYQFVSAVDCDTVFDYEYGGKFNCHYCTVELGCKTILRVFGAGSGNESFHFGTLTTDANITNMPVIIRHDKNQYMSLLIDQFHTPASTRQKPRPEPIFQLQPQGRCRILQGQWLNRADTDGVDGLTVEHMKY